MKSQVLLVLWLVLKSHLVFVELQPASLFALRVAWLVTAWYRFSAAFFSLFILFLILLALLFKTFRNLQVTF